MLYALLFLPALAAIAYILLRPRPVAILEETAVLAANPFDTIDAILEQLESATLDERGADELERLAGELEAAAAQLERVG